MNGMSWGRTGPVICCSVPAMCTKALCLQQRISYIRKTRGKCNFRWRISTSKWRVFFWLEGNEDMLGLRSECAWSKLQYKETRSAVQRMKWYLINNRVNRMAMCLKFIHVWKYFNTLRTGDADLRFYVTTVQDGWRRFAFLTRWNSVHLQVLLSATPQGAMFPEVSHPQALLGSLLSISWKFQFTKIVSEFVINF